MSDYLLIKHGSPTLAGLKSGSLFSCAYASSERMRQAIRDANRRLSAKGLRVLALRWSAQRALIYLYRPEALAAEWRQEATAALLRQCGYPDLRLGPCLRELMRRLAEQEDFPHEIGLFLGYPPEDVRGFIRYQGACCKCCGCWKVYGNETAARQLFARYRGCTEHFCRQWARGWAVEQLAVAG